MAYSINAKDHFNTKLYTGTGSSNALTGVGFQPDFTWIKVRSEANNHELYDAVRGVTKRIYSDQTSAEDTNTAGLTAFGTDGFTVNTGGAVNGSSKTYAAWNWKAGGGQGSSNTDGTINTTYTSANTTSGFSISTYTGTGSVATVGHGLGSVPKTIIIKRLNTTSNWGVYHSSLGATKYLLLNTSDPAGTASSIWNDTAPTSSVFTIGTSNDVNASGGTYVAYCFAEKTGFSKFGQYTGNGNADGAFVYTGFKPKFIITKKTNQNGYNFYMWDTARDIDNPAEKVLFADNNNAEADYSSYPHDILSNGFKVRSNNGAFNGSGDPYIYMAFAEAPLVGTNNVPCTAR